MTEKTLTAAAFGADPGRWPLPAATTPRHRWLRAVAAGGQGRYASARTDLAALLRAAPGGTLASLAHSTQGSLLRQLGWHTRARGYDGRALALAADEPEATADALIGLAADALGVGRFAASATLLERAAPPTAACAAWAPRLPVRRAWVAAELAMAVGDGAAALRHARAARELVVPTLRRHGVKSEVVLAAAHCSAGDIEAARAVADAALDAAGELALVPLRWALTCLLAEIGSAVYPAVEVLVLRDAAAETVRRGGGMWCDR